MRTPVRSDELWSLWRTLVTCDSVGHAIMRIAVGTWNVFGVAHNVLSFLRWRGVVDSQRLSHPTVSAELTDLDLVCMQEVFLGDAEEFFDGLPHSHKHRDTNETRIWPLTVGGSGLGLASKHRIVESGIQEFSRPQVSSERFARKGALFARVDVGGISFDVITTHLQSGYSKAARRVRERQLREIRQLVEKWSSPHHPVLLLGDFNICGLDPNQADGEYRTLLGHFAEFEDAGSLANCPTFHPDPEINSLAYRGEQHAAPQRIDYILFRPPKLGATVQLVEASVQFVHPLHIDGRRMHASDHFGLRATLEIHAAAPGESHKS